MTTQRNWSLVQGPQTRWLRLAGTFVLTALAIAFLFSQVTLSALVAVLQRVSFWWFAAAVACYLIATVIRAVRFALLLEIDLRRLQDVLAITLAQSMFVSLLPARTGELSFIYLAKSNLGAPLGRGTGVLLLTRLLDYLQVMLLFVLVAVAIRSSLPAQAGIVVNATVGVLALGVILLATLAGFGHETYHYLERFVPRRVRGHPAAQRIRDAILELINTFASLRLRRTSAVLLGQTLLIWALYFGMSYFLLVAIHVPVSLWQAIIATALSVFITTIPWFAVAGFGLVEAGWTAGLMLVGLRREMAVSASFAVHLLILAAVVPVGIGGWLFAHRSAYGVAQPRVRTSADRRMNDNRDEWRNWAFAVWVVVVYVFFLLQFLRQMDKVKDILRRLFGIG